jgi:hypothetical protein
MWEVTGGTARKRVELPAYRHASRWNHSMDIYNPNGVKVGVVAPAQGVQTSIEDIELPEPKPDPQVVGTERPRMCKQCEIVKDVWQFPRKTKGDRQYIQGKCHQCVYEIQRIRDQIVTDERLNQE